MGGGARVRGGVTAEEGRVAAGEGGEEESPKVSPLCSQGEPSLRRRSGDGERRAGVKRKAATGAGGGLSSREGGGAGSRAGWSRA